jgi:FkbM family methyltransferase
MVVLIFSSKLATIKNLLCHLSIASIAKLALCVAERRWSRYRSIGTVTLRTRTGISFSIRRGTSDVEVVLEVFGRGEYACAHSIADVTTVVDLGANIGLAAIFLYDRLGYKRIIAVEPENSNFSLLKENLNALRVRGVDIQLIRAAVWSNSNGVKLSFDEGEYWRCRVDCDESVKGNAIDSITLEDIVSRTEHPIDLLKVDIEGAEAEVLKNISGGVRHRIRFFGSRIPLARTKVRDYGPG